MGELFTTRILSSQENKATNDNKIEGNINNLIYLIETNI